MSALMRMALRLGAIEVIRADPVIRAATASGSMVFDSEMGAIDQADPLRPVPVIIVHTESQVGAGWSKNNGGPPFDAPVTLVFEISHVAVDEDNGQPCLFWPETTRELEAALDLIEWRIVDALAFAETTLASGFRRLILKRISDMRSERFASDDVGVRIASRLLSLTVDLHEEQQPDCIYPGDPLPAGIFGRFPEPVRAFAALFQQGSSAYETMKLAADRLAPPAAGVAFLSTDFTMDIVPDGLRPAT